MRKTVAILIFAVTLLLGPQSWAQDDTTDMAPDTAATMSAPDSAKMQSDQASEAKMGDQPGQTEQMEESQPAATEEVMKDTMPKAESQPQAKQEAESVDPNAPYSNVTFAPGEKPRIRMETTMGTIVLELWPDVAPIHCKSFYYLTEKGFYDSLTFHRIVPGFVIQGGCPYGNGTGGPGYNIPAEFSDIPHEDGILSMARASDPNSAGSQFFICLGRLRSLDNKYTVFGKVVEGLDVVHKIEAVPVTGERPQTPVVMTKVEVIKPEEPAGTPAEGENKGEE